MHHSAYQMKTSLPSLMPLWEWVTIVMQT